MTFTRRNWIRRLAGAGLALQCAAFAADHRIYRADVVISVLGVPIFNRRAAGGGRAAVRETGLGEGKSVTLQFAGGADPERTHGIHYFGSMEEVILERPAGMEAACFGFVTARSANHETFEDARRYLVSTKLHRAANVAAVYQLVQPGRIRNMSATLAAGDAAWREWPDLMRQVRSDFERANVTTEEITPSGTSTPFLYAVLSAVRARGATSLTILHNAKPYRLECEKSLDRHAGANFSARRLTDCPQSVVRLTCQIRDLVNGHTSPFKLWLDPSSELPLRIEFSPRSYLHIPLEFDPTLESPVSERSTHAEK